MRPERNNSGLEKQRDHGTRMAVVVDVIAPEFADQYPQHIQ